MPRKLLWVDGVNSAVMAHMMLVENPDALVVHCDLGSSVHEDSRRFIDDLEVWFDRPIIRIKSQKYDTIDDVFEKRKYLSGINGAVCTSELKFAPRMDFQLPSDIHYWGYTADKLDAKRFNRMVKAYPLLNQRSPLIEHGITKDLSHSILSMFGIQRPYVYDVGMPNGNCIGCVKSSSPNYWSLIRKFFPDVFARRNDQARRFGARLVILRREKQQDGKYLNIRGFPDEVPADWPTTMRGISWGGCGFHCATN